MRTFGVAVSAAALTVLAGCCSLDQPALPSAPKPVAARPAPLPTSSTGCPVVGRDGANIISRQAIPTGAEGSSVLLLEKSAPAEVAVGQEFTYAIKATNLTPCELDEVVVTDTIPQGIDYKGSTPTGTQAGNLLTWDLGSIPGKGSKTITLKGVATGTGEYTSCVRATYKEKLCLTIKAVQPKLTLDKTAPAEVLVCDIIPVKLVVKNPGTGPTTGVVVTDTLPAGLKTVDGKTEVKFDVATLNAGESKEFSFNAQAAKPGSYANKAVATANGGLTDDAATTTVVKQPVLTIAKTATEMVYEGRPVSYSIKVGNKGDAAAAGTVVTDTLPAGVAFVSATDGGTFANGVVTWNLGSLAPNAEKTVGITGKGTAQGRQCNKADAKATCAEPVSATACTEVKGLAALLLEVIDISDPIEVNGQETYEITVTNQGTAVDTNIKIDCTLEDAQAYVSSSGATAGTATGQKVSFAPLASLAPKAKAQWKVVVKALKAGDIRFAVQLDSDVTERPVNETESTHQY
jgi:uncharacterized repeat protein (TIGR01451 family)